MHQNCFCNDVMLNEQIPILQNNKTETTLQSVITGAGKDQVSYIRGW